MDRINRIKSVKEDILERGYSFVLYGEKGLIHASLNSGIKPLLHAYEAGDIKTAGAYAGDKIIGKASAMLLVLMEVEYVFAKLISEPALEYLKSYKISLDYEYTVRRIINRTKDGLCPMEEAVLEEDDPKRALSLLTEKLNELSQGSQDG